MTNLNWIPYALSVGGSLVFFLLGIVGIFIRNKLKTIDDSIKLSVKDSKERFEKHSKDTEGLSNKVNQVLIDLAVTSSKIDSMGNLSDRVIVLEEGCKKTNYDVTAAHEKIRDLVVG